MEKIYIPCLDYMMQQRGCTNSALAKASGLSVSTIRHVRAGKSVLCKNGFLILQALNERKFGYKSRAGLNRLKRNYASIGNVAGADRELAQG